MERELQNAARAREGGNEGRARVCARRAAAIAVRAYLVSRGKRARSASALDLLQQLRDQEPLAPDLLTIVEHLTLRVDQNFSLPEHIDLVADARLLCNRLSALQTDGRSTL
jgi:HEPN domain-containing protein